MPETDWTNYTPALPASHTVGYFDLPAFNLAAPAWKGASEIARQYNYSASKNMAFRARPAKPSGVNYGLCVRYRQGDVVTRYKLWDDANFILPYVPLYTGQIIKKNFVLEIWSLQGQANLSQASTIRLTSGIRRTVTDFTAIPADYADDTGEAAASLQAAALVVPPVPNPADPSNPNTALRLHWKADAGVTHVGGLVSDWAEQSGTGYNLSGGTGGLSFIANGFGPLNKPYLHWPGVGGPKIENLAAPPAAVTHTWYLAMQIPIWVAGAVILDCGPRVLTMNPTDKKLRSAWVVNSEIDYAAYAAKPFILRLDVSTPLNNANRIQAVLLEDITRQIALTETDTGGFSTPNPTKVVLGGSASGYAFYIAEILAYQNGNLGAAGDLAVKSYLAARYAAIVNLPLSFDVSSPWLDNS